ncbi:hypothetical protein MZM54_03295 [[Brevibacterium] frigoritolerans]|nr:hypothetical protein [Peribacillus frigoritolerans]
MIYEETYQFLLHNVSSTEFDACLYSLLRMDWDGVIQSTTTQLAERIGTTKKYIQQILRKFSSKKRRNVLIPIISEDGTKYRFNLGPTMSLGFNSKTDRYCKKYEFFYTDSFRSLPINAKRLLLMGAFRMSVLQTEQVKFNYSEIVPNSYQQGHPSFTKSRLNEAINAIHKSGLSNLVKIGLASHTESRKEVIVFTFQEGTLQKFVENQTERVLLRNKIYEAGYIQYISDEVCIEIEKVGKYLYNSFLRLEKLNAKKNGVLCDAKDELLKLARFIYNLSIKKFSSALHSNQQLLAEPKQASAYFSTIVYNHVFDELASYGHQASSIKSLLEDFHYLHRDIASNELGRRLDYYEVDDHIAPIQLKLNFINHIFSVLNDWCENWVISRVKTVAEDVEFIVDPNNNDEEAKQKIKEKRGWLNPLEALHHLKEMKSNTYEHIDRLTSHITSIGNKAVKKVEKRTDFIRKIKESLSSYFSIQLERIENLTALS